MTQARIQELEAELSALRAELRKCEPVGVVCAYREMAIIKWLPERPPPQTKLYLHPAVPCEKCAETNERAERFMAHRDDAERALEAAEAALAECNYKVHLAVLRRAEKAEAENAELRADAVLVPDLCALITRLCKQANNSPLAQQAMDYLKRKDRLHSALRSPLSGPMNKGIFDAAIDAALKESKHEG